MIVHCLTKLIVDREISAILQGCAESHCGYRVKICLTTHIGQLAKLVFEGNRGVILPVIPRHLTTDIGYFYDRRLTDVQGDIVPIQLWIELC